MSYLFLFLISTIFPTFAEGRAKSIEDRKPLLTIVSAEWCLPCQTLKRDVIKPMEKNGDFEDVVVCILDIDKTDEYITNQVITKRTVPQLVMYFKKDGEWKILRVSGYDNNPEKMKNTIKEMIKRATNEK